MSARDPLDGGSAAREERAMAGRGHSIVARAVLVGMTAAVREMKAALG